MWYKNYCIIISNEKDCRVNEPFNEYLNYDEYFIYDIEKLSQDIGEKIIKRFDDRKKNIGYHKIKELVSFEIKELEYKLEKEIEEYLDNNW